MAMSCASASGAIRGRVALVERVSGQHTIEGEGSPGYGP
jgi:hypothetical protein